MQTGFDNFDIVTQWRPDAPDLVVSGGECWWRGHKFRHRPGGYTDGLSSPQFMHVIQSTDSRGWGYPAAVIHDAGYHDDLETWRPARVIDQPNGRSDTIPGYWEKFSLTKDEADIVFKELLDTIANTAAKKAEAIAFYEAVHLAGQSSFDAARSERGALLRNGGAR